VTAERAEGVARPPRGGDTGPEHALLSNRRRDSIAAAVVTLVTLLFYVLMAFRMRLPAIQHMDDRWLRLMVDVRAGPYTAVALLFNFLGLVYVTLPVRLAVAGFLAWRRRWWHFAAFVSAMVVSELLIGTLKNVYHRPRPPVHPLVHTSGASFPSGHAVAASVTSVAIVIALFPNGPRRFWWGVGAAAFSFVMTLSRTYLAAHWLTDAIAGTLLGVAIAVDCALVVQEIWDATIRRRLLRSAENVSEPPGPAAAGDPGARGGLGTPGPDG
jgi:membrane-associated phospholipid phosphatase